MVRSPRRERWLGGDFGAEMQGGGVLEGDFIVESDGLGLR